MNNTIACLNCGAELEVNLDLENYAIYDRDGKIICDTLPEFIIVKEKEY